MLQPCGKSIKISVFVDADHAGEITTRQSQARILIYINMAPIIWLFQRQITCEASAFGRIFFAM